MPYANPTAVPVPRRSRSPAKHQTLTDRRSLPDLDPIAPSFAFIAPELRQYPMEYLPTPGAPIMPCDGLAATTQVSTALVLPQGPDFRRQFCVSLSFNLEVLDLAVSSDYSTTSIFPCLRTLPALDYLYLNLQPDQKRTSCVLHSQGSPEYSHRTFAPHRTRLESALREFYARRRATHTSSTVRVGGVALPRVFKKDMRRADVLGRDQLEEAQRLRKAVAGNTGAAAPAGSCGQEDPPVRVTRSAGKRPARRSVSDSDDEYDDYNYYSDQEQVSLLPYVYPALSGLARFRKSNILGVHCCLIPVEVWSQILSYVNEKDLKSIVIANFPHASQQAKRLFWKGIAPDNGKLVALYHKVEHNPQALEGC
ncbi:hypothetical protein KCU89_g6633, partial [Aureobasidium melanogenum]